MMRVRFSCSADTIVDNDDKNEKRRRGTKFGNKSTPTVETHNLFLLRLLGL